MRRHDAIPEEAAGRHPGRATLLRRAATLAIFTVLLVAGRPSLSAADAGPVPLPQLAPPETGAPATLPDRPTAYLVTIGRGAAIWERFGHNLLWIHDPIRNSDEAYNYGLFSFEQENFLLRFVQGHMEYWMGGFDIQRQLQAYSRDGRSIEIQELDLAPGEVEEMQEFLEWNERPENRFYRYHYYRDNCSTRVRDALDRILDGRLQEWARARATPETLRDHTLRQADGLFWINVGMHFGLGPSVDHPLSAWEAMFIPMELRDHLLDFPAQPGGSASLVRRQWTYHTGALPPAPGETPRWTGGFLTLGLLAGVFYGALGLLAGPGRSGARAALVTAATPVLAVAGVLGILIGALWAFTDHVDTHLNVNLLYATPLHLALAILWPLAGAGGRGGGRASTWAVRTALLMGAMSLVGLLVEALPAIQQTNAEFVWFLVPVNLALCWAVWRTEEAREPRAPRDLRGIAESPPL